MSPRDHWNWTALGVELGWVGTDQQRRAILAAACHMTWTAPTAGSHRLGAAVDAITTTLRGHSTAPLRRIGASRIADGTWLVGLEHASGDRVYLLDLGDTTVHVLTEHNARQPVA